MKKAIYNVTTEDGQIYTLKFEEIHHENTYGNGNYIVVVSGKEVIAYIDVRYIHYVFETFCENYIKGYYGDNLFTFKRVQ